MKQIRIRRAAALSLDEQRELHRLHARFFDNAGWDEFQADFAEKDYVITAADASEYLAFSTIKLHDELVDGRRTVFLFSGDTIVHPDYWQANLLAPAFSAFLGRMIDDYGEVPLYWFLITKGYRTYMYLPTFFEDYYPRPDAPTPPAIRRLIEYIARRRFGDRYDPETGIIGFDGGRDYLNADLRRVPELRADGKYVSFFLKANPGYGRGDELACLTRCARDNIKPLGLRLLAFTGVKWEI